jgi:hypothetical protein
MHPQQLVLPEQLPLYSFPGKKSSFGWCSNPHGKAVFTVFRQNLYLIPTKFQALKTEVFYRINKKKSKGSCSKSLYFSPVLLKNTGKIHIILPKALGLPGRKHGTKKPGYEYLLYKYSYPDHRRLPSAILRAARISKSRRSTPQQLSINTGNSKKSRDSSISSRTAHKSGQPSFFLCRIPLLPLPVLQLLPVFYAPGEGKVPLRA